MNKDKFRLIFLFFLLVVSNLFAQDFHQREAKSVEELIYQKDPNRAKTMFNKGNYLVVENLRTNSRNRFYVGDNLSFKTKDDFIFSDDIYEVKDSSFVVTALNEVTNRYEYIEISLNEIQRIYKRPKKSLHISLLNLTPFGYLIFEWAAWNTPPLQNTKLPIAIGLTVAQPLLTIITNQFRSKKITENYRVRIFKSL